MMGYNLGVFVAILQVFDVLFCMSVALCDLMLDVETKSDQ